MCSLSSSTALRKVLFHKGLISCDLPSVISRQQKTSIGNRLKRHPGFNVCVLAIMLLYEARLVP